jgi:hypothetical protein
MTDEVLDYLFDTFLPQMQVFIDGGALMPSDFDGATDVVDGRSKQAYEKARLRAVDARGAGAKPYLLWSHDEACADAVDYQRRAWVKEGAKRIASKGNSGHKVMAMDSVSAWGPGYLSMTEVEFEEAKTKGYDGPRRALVLFEISRDDDPAELAAVLEAIGGVGGCVDPFLDTS